MLRVGYIAILVFVNLLKAQVAAPQLRCLATSTNGDITLTWIPSADPGGVFSSYEIYYATSKVGPYSNVGSIPTILTNSFTHGGAGGDIQGRFYFVNTKYGPGGSITSSNSDTLKSIFLNLINSPGLVGVNYNNLKLPSLSSSASNFSILREFPAGTWSNLTNTSALAYNDTISQCLVAYNYKIVLGDNSGCASVSNLKGGVYSDKNGPTRVAIDSVSVLPNGQVVIGYPPSISSDCSGYYIYQVINGINTKIDSISGINNTAYTFTTSAASGTSVVFIVAPFDSCNNVGLLNTSHKTMYLESNYDKCKYQTNLSWNPYVNMKGGISEYRVYYSVNGSNYQMIGSTTQTTFTHNNVDPSKNISYYVRAFNTSKTITSSSNRISFFSQQTIAPDFIYIRSADVKTDDEIELRFFVDSIKIGNNFDLYRSNDGLSFNKIASIGSNFTGFYVYTDKGVDTKLQAYYYKAIAKDSCGNDRTMSNIVESACLKVEADAQQLFVRKLKWNNYMGFNGGNAGYSVYRIVNGVVPSAPTGYTNGSLNEYEDNIEQVASEGSKVEYIVTAIEGLGNIYGITELANSNKAITYMEGDVFIPTAFAPKGKNKIWKPVTHFVDKSEYDLKIFNRWGNLLMHTTDDAVGWDGNGAANDVYVYLIEYKNARGEYIQLKGTFVLL